MKILSLALFSALMICGSLSHAYTFSPNESALIGSLSPSLQEDYKVLASHIDEVSGTDTDRKMFFFTCLFIKTIGGPSIEVQIKEASQVPGEQLKNALVQVREHMRQTPPQPGFNMEQNMEELFKEFLDHKI